MDDCLLSDEQWSELSRAIYVYDQQGDRTTLNQVLVFILKSLVESIDDQDDPTATPNKNDEDFIEKQLVIALIECELAELIDANNCPRWCCRQRRQRIQPAKAFDNTNSGFISKEQIQTCFGAHISERKMAELLQFAETKDNGHINYREKGTTVDRLIEIFNYDILELNPLKQKLGYVSTNGNFYPRLGYRSSLDRLLLLVKTKMNLRMNSLVVPANHIEYDIAQKLTELWENTPTVSNHNNAPILISWIKNIVENLKRPKNKFSYDHHIQQFALLLLILGSRNCYEFLRLNLYGALPHITNLELLKDSSDLIYYKNIYSYMIINTYFHRKIQLI
ncbi:unnamed protein product [Adineta ricciae]|uniref:EF-hand domain-containing protein n=1 Tax=Adineta ricciae TaxID=249248 RepID=A0A813RN12_ADIRI|nr:unnamed protein product [Adineta ricciae]